MANENGCPCDRLCDGNKCDEYADDWKNCPVYIEEMARKKAGEKDEEEYWAWIAKEQEKIGDARVI